ncbi:MAG: dihydrodipicolinate synthase family protein [Anaerolineae bacterium]
MHLTGIFPPIITPFRDGEVDIEALAFNIQKWNGTGLAGYVPLGSTGEFVHLTPAERERVIATVREHAAPDKAVIAGTGSLSTAEATRLTRRAGELGADAAMVVTPFYYTSQMTDAALRAHYTAVADASPIPILLYNVPIFTHLNMAVETVARLAEHPNIAGMKDSSGNVDQLTQIVHSTPADFILLSGAAGVVHPALTIGADGAILAVSNVVPELCVEIYDLVKANDHAMVRRRQAVLGAVNRAISRYGIGGYKFAMELCGYRGGRPRPPLLPPDEVGRQAIRAALVAAGVLTG